MVDVSIIATAVALMFSDDCDVYRYSEQTDSFGAKRARRGSLPELSAVSCLISQTAADDAANRLKSNIPLDKGISIHVAAGTGLRAGDYVVARKRSRGQVVCTYRGTIGEPAVYPSHVMAELRLDDATR